MRAVERRGEIVLQRNRQFERLPAIAQVGLAVRGQIVHICERAHVRDDAVAPLVTRDEAQRREDPRRLGHEHSLDAELFRKRARVQRSCAAVCDEREVARIVPTLDGDDAQRAQHLGVHDLDDRRRVDSRERTFSGSAVENEPARERIRQPSEQEVRVGHGRAAARAVTRGAGMRARALRPDANRSAGVEAHE